MYYPDLSCYRVGSPDDPLQYVFPDVRYVGWLGADISYTTGKVEANLAKKLKEILFLDIQNAEANQHGSFDNSQAIQMHRNYQRGLPHPCPFCNATVTVKPAGLTYYLGSREKTLGRNQFCLPGAEGLFYEAPTLIYHYVTEHQYRPPQLFLDALEAFNFNIPFDANTAKANLTCLQVPTHLVNQLHLHPIPQEKYLSC